MVTVIPRPTGGSGDGELGPGPRGRRGLQPEDRAASGGTQDKTPRLVQSLEFLLFLYLLLFSFKI